MIEYISLIILPVMILVILITAAIEKKDVYSLFIQGAVDGLKIVYKVFPYILGITVAIGLLNATGTLHILTKPLSKLIIALGVPEEVIPLMIIRPMSGGASMGIVMNIFEKFGVDSKSGKISSIIMGGTETTLYTITILFSVCKSKNIRGVLIAGLLADLAAIITAIFLVNIGMI